MANVVMLNLCYAVPVKLLSSHMLVASIGLLGLDRGRLWVMFVLNRAANSAVLLPAMPTGRVTVYRVSKALLFGVMAARYALMFSPMPTSATERPFYGVWEVDRFVLDGQEHPALTTDPTRWEHVVFDRYGGITLWNLNGLRQSYRGNVEPGRVRMVVDGGAVVADLKADRRADQLVLEGLSGGTQIRVELHKRPDFPLTSRQFQWIMRYPH